MEPGAKKPRFVSLPEFQGCGIKGFLPTSVIQGNPALYEDNSLWEALSVVSQKWSFPTALLSSVSKIQSLLGVFFASLVVSTKNPDFSWGINVQEVSLIKSSTCLSEILAALQTGQPSCSVT